MSSSIGSRFEHVSTRPQQHYEGIIEGATLLVPHNTEHPSNSQLSKRSQDFKSYCIKTTGRDNVEVKKRTSWRTEAIPNVFLELIHLREHVQSLHPSLIAISIQPRYVSLRQSPLRSEAMLYPAEKWPRNKHGEGVPSLVFGHRSIAVSNDGRRE